VQRTQPACGAEAGRGLRRPLVLFKFPAVASPSAQSDQAIHENQQPIFRAVARMRWAGSRSYVPYRSAIYQAIFLRPADIHLPYDSKLRCLAGSVINWRLERMTVIPCRCATFHSPFSRSDHTTVRRAGLQTIVIHRPQRLRYRDHDHRQARKSRTPPPTRSDPHPTTQFSTYSSLPTIRPTTQPTARTPAPPTAQGKSPNAARHPRRVHRRRRRGRSGRSGRLPCRQQRDGASGVPVAAGLVGIGIGGDRDRWSVRTLVWFGSAVLGGLARD
jgi:hypothetical protein